MKEKLTTAAIILAAFLYLFLVHLLNANYKTEYKDVYEQMRMEQMIM